MRTYSWKRYTANLMGLTLFGVTASTAHAASECKMSAAELPVTMSGTRPVLAAKINGEDARFVLDSGAFWSMITQAAAEQYKLKTAPAPYGLTVTGIGGTTTPRVARVKTLGVAGIPISNIDFLVGGSEVGSGSIGLLGQNLLEKFDVEYDLAKGIIRLIKSEGCSHANLAYWLTPNQLYTKIGISIITPMEPHTSGIAYVNGVKVRVMFDTGAATSVLSLRAAARAGVKIDTPGVLDTGYAWGIGQGMVKVYVARFASLKFGEDGEEINNARLQMADINLASADMLIGSDFFLSHRILVAHSQRQLYFTYNGGPVFNLSKTIAKTAPPDAAQGEPVTTTDHPQTSAVSDGPSDAAGFARRGSAYAGRRDFDHAIPDLNRAIELDPGIAEYYYQRAMIYWQQRQGKSALTDFDQALALKPDHVPALMSRARFRLADKDYDGAKSDLDAADQFASKQDNVRRELAELNAEAGRRDVAIAQFDLWIQSHPEDAQLASALNGRCLNRALLGRDLTEALADCNKAISRSAKAANAAELGSRGLVRLRLGDYDKSIADYDASIKLQPNNPWSLYGRGIAKLRKNQRTGDADIAAAIQIAPGVAKRYENIGIVP